MDIKDKRLDSVESIEKVVKSMMTEEKQWSESNNKSYQEHGLKNM
jgi:hypothetical protein